MSWWDDYKKYFGIGEKGFGKFGSQIKDKVVTPINQKVVQPTQRFVRQNPTPASFVNQRVVRPTIQKVQPRIQQTYNRAKPTFQDIGRNLWKYQTGSFVDKDLKDLPNYIKDPLKVPTYGRDLAKVALQAIPRGAAQLYNQTAPKDKQIEPKSRVGKIIYGDQPVGSFTGRSEYDRDYLISKGVNPKAAKVLGAGLAGLGLAADITPFGGGKSSIAKKLSKAVKADDVIKILGKGSKAAKDKNLVTKLVKETNPKNIENMISNAGKVVKPSVVSDVKKVLTGAKEKERGFVTTIKESKNTPKVLKDIVEGTYIPKSTSELKTQAKKLIQNNIDVAEKVAVNPTNDTHIQIGNELMNHYVSTGQINKAKALSSSMAEAGTEFGRAVQAFANYDKTTPEGAIRFAQSTINKYNRANPNSKLELADDTIKSLFERAKSIQNMTEGRERSIASQQLINEVNELIPSSVADKAVTVWKAGLLTSLRTTERNLLGNTLHAMAEAAKDIPGSVADMVLKLRTGKRTLTPTLKGTGQGIKKGFGRASDIMTFGFDPEKTIAKFDVQKISWGKNRIEQGLKKYTDFVFNWMGAQDKPFYHSAFARSLYDQAGAMAINAGKRGNSAFVKQLVNNPTEDMVKAATKDATIAVFQDKNALSKMINGLKQKAGGARWVTEIFAPFTGVPSSIAGQMVAYSPVGLGKGIWDSAKVLLGKTPEIQRQAAQEVGRGVIGSGIMGVGAILASKGLITGQPKDAKEARQWELEGKQANSIYVNGKWRSINSVGPEALIALAGSKIQASEDLSQAAGNIGKDFFSQTFLSGVQQPLNVITDPERYAGSYKKSQAASLIPNIVKDISKAVDPVQRETNNAIEAIKAGLPGARNTLLPRRDVLGQPLKNETTGWRAFLDLFNAKTPTNDPVVNELSRLNNAGERATPSKLTKNQTIFGQKIELTPEQLDSFEKTAGSSVKQIIGELIGSKEYSNATDEEKKKSIDSIVQDIRKTAKENMATGGGLIDESQLTGKYKSKLAQTQFEQEYGSNSVSKAQYTLNYQTAKRNNDLDSYLKASSDRYEYLEQYKKILDPIEDKAKLISIQNEQDDINFYANKYIGYGGFKKGSSDSSGRKGSRSSSRKRSFKKMAITDTSAPTKKASVSVPKSTYRLPRAGVSSVRVPRQQMKLTRPAMVGRAPRRRYKARKITY